MGGDSGNEEATSDLSPKDEKEQIAGGVRKGTLSTDHSRLESELQPTLPFPAGPIGPTEKHSSSGYHIKVPEITSRDTKSPYKELRLRTWALVPGYVCQIPALLFTSWATLN